MLKKQNGNGRYWKGHDFCSEVRPVPHHKKEGKHQKSWSGPGQEARLEHHPIHQKVRGLIPQSGHILVPRLCRPCPQAGSMQEATDLYFSLASMFLSLVSLSLSKINKYILGWGLKIYTLKWKKKRNGLFGQKIGQSPGFSYIHANKKKGIITWVEMSGESHEGPPWNKNDLCWH